MIEKLEGLFDLVINGLPGVFTLLVEVMFARSLILLIIGFVSLTILPYIGYIQLKKAWVLDCDEHEGEQTFRAVFGAFAVLIGFIVTCVCLTNIQNWVGVVSPEGALVWKFLGL